MLIKPADNALTTLEVIKELQAIEDTASDRWLTLLINSASAWVETMTGRHFGKRTYIEKHAASGTQRLMLNQYPILSVSSVCDMQSDAVISPDEYDFAEVDNMGILFKETCWPYRGYAVGLAGDMRVPARYLKVIYTAGYVLPKDETEDCSATLPADLQAVVWGIVDQEYSLRKNGAQGLTAFSIADVSWTFDKQPRQSWLETLKRYER